MSLEQQNSRAWFHGQLLNRFLGDLLSAELSRLRRYKPSAPFIWDDHLNLGEEGLNLDSLERLRISMAVTRSFDMSKPNWTNQFTAAATFGEFVQEVRHVLSSTEFELQFQTSGSTGDSRTVRHASSSLEQEIQELHNILGNPRRIISYVSSHHIYGFLFTILLPHRLGIEVIDARQHAPAAAVTLCKPGDLIVAFPTIFESTSTVTWPESITAISSGAACPAEIAAKNRNRGLSEFVEIYGSTETGGIGWRNDETKPFQLLSYWQKIDDDHIQKHSGQQRVTYLLPDEVQWTDGNLLRPIRRRDGAIQIAGVNVYPRYVRSVVCANPLVGDVQIRPMRPDEGEGLKAFIVLKQPEQELADVATTLYKWMKERLSAAEIPRSLTFGNALPVTNSGKPADWICDAEEGFLFSSRKP